MHKGVGLETKTIDEKERKKPVKNNTCCILYL
jgi:hypothetical protein